MTGLMRTLLLYAERREREGDEATVPLHALRSARILARRGFVAMNRSTIRLTDAGREALTDAAAKNLKQASAFHPRKPEVGFRFCGLKPEVQRT
jgi:hypothetical protein